MTKYRMLPAMAMMAMIAFSVNMSAQSGDKEKKAMDHDVYDSWQRVSGVTVSDDGNVLVWLVDPEEGDGTLFVRNSATSGRKAGGRKDQARQLSVPRGYGFSLDPDGRWLYCRIKPEFAKNRKEKIDKKKSDEMTKDTLAVVNLTDMTVKRYPNAESVATGFRSMPYVAYKTSWKAFKDSTDKKGTKKSGLVILDPAASHADTLMNIDKYRFSCDGLRLALTTLKDKKDKTTLNSVVLMSLPSAKMDTLARDAEFYGMPVFDDATSMLAFTASKDTNKTGGKRCSLFLAKATKDKSEAWDIQEIFKPGTTVDNTSGWTLNENSDIFFTKDGKRLFTGIASIRPPKDTSIVDFETAKLDIWNWDSPLTPPEQKIRLDRTLKKTYSAVINLDNPGKIIPLTTSAFDNIRLLDGGLSGWAVSFDDGKYVRSSAWDYRNLTDISLVSLADGSRKTLFTALDGRCDLSPNGKYLIWFDNSDLNWHTYDIAEGKTADLTGKTGVKFYDEENDRPMPPEPYDQSPKWVEGDKAVLIIDRYDVWKFSPDGSAAVNLTSGKGRETRNRFTTLFPVPDRLTENERRCGVKQSLGSKDLLYFSVLNEDDERNGFGRTSLARPKAPEYFVDTVTFLTVSKARNTDRIAFLKGNFSHPYDLYLTDNFFSTDQRLTSINPQMAGYRWGHVELFRWNAYDGTPLKGLVFIPDGIKSGEKLPVMVYFYEKYSEQRYSFWTPVPSRSTVNIPLYTSRGYICFIPDIVYKVGHPGESAWNCVCSGAEALCRQYSFADKDKMGIQGQSWGGYQTAYLVTRTDMFAAAGAGAPVGNMTSAYGGIRWESGITRAGQYEHGQSRIGKNMWEEGGRDLYIENSPVFHADKVKTPILIMHNDSDGAVPWYQGIEYFSDLRRLGKPAWLLEYNDEEHNLVQRRNCKDLSKRLQQFFDCYLKGSPMPAWMKTGVPEDRKGEYFGFENAE